MVDAGIVLLLDGMAGPAKCGREPSRVVRQHRRVGVSSGEQDRRCRPCRHCPVDRLRAFQRADAGKRCSRGVDGERQEVIGTGEAGCGPHDRSRETLDAEKLGGQCHHHGVVGAGRMAGQVQLGRVRAIAARIAAGPGHGLCRILDEGRIADTRNQPVVEEDGDVAPGGKGAAGKAVIGLAAVVPGAAIGEDQHAERIAASRYIDVELLARLKAIGEVLRRKPRAVILRHEAVEGRQRRAACRRQGQGYGGQEFQNASPCRHHPPVNCRRNSIRQRAANGCGRGEGEDGLAYHSPFTAKNAASRAAVPISRPGAGTPPRPAHRPAA